MKGDQHVNRFLLISVLAAGTLLASCAKDDALRTEGLTLGAGDAIARNTALQVIDPWPAGVEDTELLVPSDRGAPPAAPAAVASSTLTTN